MHYAPTNYKMLYEHLVLARLEELSKIKKKFYEIKALKPIEDKSKNKMIFEMLLGMEFRCVDCFNFFEKFKEAYAIEYEKDHEIKSIFEKLEAYQIGARKMMEMISEFRQYYYRIS